MSAHASPSLSTRREFLRAMSLSLAAGTLAHPDRLAASASPREALAPPSGAFRFIVVNDLHHAAPDCTPLLEALVAHMRDHGPVEFCLVVGDLADKGERASLEAVRDAFGALGAPVYPVPGNHDCDIGENPDLYSSVFPERLNYAFAHRGWQFVGLDTTDGNAWQNTRIGAHTREFLRTTVPTLDPRAPTVVFTHFPLSADVRMASLDAGEILGAFADHDLRHVFGGHFHSRTENRHGKALLETNTCCSRVRSPHDGTSSEGYLLCTAHPDGTLERAFVEFAPAMDGPKPIV
jgi:hypothetical protein